MDGRLRGEDGRQTCWPSPTTATSATAGCSRSSRPSASAIDQDLRRRAREVGAPLRDDADQGRPARRTPSCRPTTNSPTSRLWDKGNLDVSGPEDEGLCCEFEYARSGAQERLAARRRRSAANPYKFGLVGSTDAHTGLTAVEEDNFFGKTAPAEPSPERADRRPSWPTRGPAIKIMDWEVGASGYAAVWATENTREAIFDAMQRRETYATTGSRMIVRFFGGWEFEPKDAHDRMPAKIGYAKGVPMGGELVRAPEGKAPTFLVGRAQGPDRREPGPHPDRQGLARREGRGAREGLRRRLGGRPQARPEDRQAAVGGQHRGRGERDLDQHDRRSRADRRLERPGLRRRAARRSTTPACSRSRPRAGRRTTRSASGSSPCPAPG